MNEKAKYWSLFRIVVKDDIPVILKLEIWSFLKLIWSLGKWTSIKLSVKVVRLNIVKFS